MSGELPVLNFAAAKKSYETLHLMTQVVGKIKLRSLPWINHSWHVTQALTPTGLTTGILPNGNNYFQIDFDLSDHQLKIITDQQQIRSFDLENIPVAVFYKKIFNYLKELNINLKINKAPNELEEIIPFDKDTVHADYDAEYIRQLHKTLLFANEVFTLFRAEFKGKCSPVHFFWGSFDLAVSRFSGRSAPLHPGGIPNLPDRVVREAYSHEVSSSGFWPGSDILPEAVFYNYIYPEPEGFNVAEIKPQQAYYHTQLKEFILPYEEVRKSKDPASTLMDFLHSSFDAASELSRWNIISIEHSH